MLFYPLYYDIISLTSLKITQTFHLLLGFAENQIISNHHLHHHLDNGDSDNRGSTVLCCVYVVQCDYIIMNVIVIV